VVEFGVVVVVVMVVDRIIACCADTCLAVRTTGASAMVEGCLKK